MLETKEPDSSSEDVGYRECDYFLSEDEGKHCVDNSEKRERDSGGN